MVPFNNSRLFRNDFLGMRELYSSNRLHNHVLHGVRHMQWMYDENAFKVAILPYLSPTRNEKEKEVVTE